MIERRRKLCLNGFAILIGSFLFATASGQTMVDTSVIKADSITALANFDECMQPLARRVATRADFSSLARDKTIEAVFDLAINREGKITYIRFNSRLSANGKIEKKILMEMFKKLKLELSFVPDPNAPKKQCGTYTIKIHPIEYQKN